MRPAPMDAAGPDYAGLLIAGAGVVVSVRPELAMSALDLEPQSASRRPSAVQSRNSRPGSFIPRRSDAYRERRLIQTTISWGLLLRP